MNHPRHRHPLKKKRDGEGPFKCSGCKELGFGTRYQCAKNCNFNLHEVCFKARPTDKSITHQFMGDCKFQFLWEPPGGPYRRLCDACGRDVQGFVYHDKYKHKLDLHPCCINLKSTMSDPNGSLELILKDKLPYECVKCKRKNLKVMSKGPFRGWSYVSSCGDYFYHVYCVKKLILENFERGYFNVASSTGTRSVKSKRSSITSSGGSVSAVARKGLLRPPRSFLIPVLVKMAKIGFSLIMSVIFGNPAPLFAALAENLVD